jgi:mRNA interferase RelE/StbE
LFKLQFKKSVKKDLRRIGETESLRILKTIKEKLIPDPRVGKPLKGIDVDIWSFRVGNYRVLYNFNDKDLIVLVIRINHRREVYKGI